MAVLYIIGNGFDRFHKLPTAYCNYREYLKDEYPDLIKEYESFPFLLDRIEDADRWTDIESSLELDYEKCLEDALQTYPLDLKQDNPGWNDPQIDLEVQTRFIKDFTGEFFFKWISSIDVERAKGFVSFNPDAVFITFNYTETLEKRYSIDDSKVLHIHGSVRDVEVNAFLPYDIGTVAPVHIPEDWDGLDVDLYRDKTNNQITKSAIQFGCPKNNSGKLREELECLYEDDDFYGAYVEPCVKVFEEFCEQAGKDIPANYPQLMQFLDDVSVDRVYVFGHSFDGIDYPYYADVLLPRYRNLPWVFVVHSLRGTEAAARFCSENGIGHYRVIQNANTNTIDVR